MATSSSPSKPSPSFLSDDPLGARQHSQRVLAAWAADPARLIEDVAAEHELAHVAHQGRLLIELLQNAHDAAVRAGQATSVLVRLRPGYDPTTHPVAAQHAGYVLEVSNSGIPFTPETLSTIAALRVSSKKGDDRTVGQFGVGFTAVAAVSDSPVICSGAGAVVFSRTRTAQLLTENEVPHGGQVPLLRVPHAVVGRARDGFDTSIVLPLGVGESAGPPEPGTPDEGVVVSESLRTVMAAVGALAEHVLLGLDHIAEVVIDSDVVPCRRLSVADARWRVWSSPDSVDCVVSGNAAGGAVGRVGGCPALARWAVPLVAGVPGPMGGGPGVVLGPTPTDVVLPWPAVLVAQLPMDESRRRVLPGPATDRVIAEAATLFATMSADFLHSDVGVLQLWPTVPPANDFDRALRVAVRDQLRGTACLPGVPGPGQSADQVKPVAPAQACALAPGPLADDVELLQVLAMAVPGLVCAPPSADVALRDLGVRRVSVAEAVAALPWSPSQWRQVVAVLAARTADPDVRRALAGLVVPLADGSVRPSPGGCVLGSELSDDAARVLAAAGVPLVAAQVAKDPAGSAVLTAGGATVLRLCEVIHRPELASFVAHVEQLADLPQLPDDGLLTWREVGEFVVQAASWALAGAQVASADPFVDVDVQLPSWVGSTLFPDGDGRPVAARDLVLPGSQLARWADSAVVSQLAQDVCGQADPAVWSALGVHVQVQRVSLVGWDPLDDDALNHDGAQEWAQSLPAGVVMSGSYLLGVDVVHPDCWAEVLQHIAGEPQLAAAVIEPVVVRQHTGGTSTEVGLSAWWLREELGSVGSTCAANVWLPRAPEPVCAVSAEFAQALGVVPDLTGLDDEGWADVLEFAGDCDPTSLDVVQLWQALAQNVSRLDWPDQVWAIDPDDGPVWVDVADVWVPPNVMWAQRSDLGPVVPVPAEYAAAVHDWLNGDPLPAGIVQSSSHSQVLLPEQIRDACHVSHWQEHAELVVDGALVRWWVTTTNGTSAQASHDGTAVVVHAVDDVAAADACASLVDRGGAQAVFRAWVSGEPIAAEELTHFALGH